MDAKDRRVIETTAISAGHARRGLRATPLSPINQRRWSNFKANKRGYWSLWIFLCCSLAACSRR